jgi:hypothetical protein
MDEEQLLIHRAVFRYQNDAEFHAKVYKAMLIVKNHIAELSYPPYYSSEDDNAFAVMCVAVGFLLEEEKSMG